MLTANGRFEAERDVDWFRIRLEAGKTYIFTLSDAFGIGLRLPDGSAVTPHYDRTAGFLLTTVGYYAESTGDYWVSLSGANVQDYSVTVTEQVDPTPPWINTPLVLIIGEGIWPAQVDPSRAESWYAVDLTGGQSYAIGGGYEEVYIADAEGNVLTRPFHSHLGHFTPDESGRYYLSIIFNINGDMLKIDPVDDDHGTSPAQAGSLNAGMVETGRWEAGGDADWFAATLTGGRSYEVDLQVLTGAFGIRPDRSVELLDAQGNVVMARTTVEHSSGKVNFDIVDTGVYYISVIAGYEYYFSAGKTPTYSVGLTEIPLADYPDIVVGQVVNESGLVSENVYHYDIYLTQGQIYNFATASSSRAFAIYDGRASLKSSHLGRLDLLAPHDGMFRVWIDSPQPRPGLTDSYTLTSSATADDFTANPLTAGVIQVGGTAEGVLQNGVDLDWFAVDLSAGKSYVFATQGVGRPAIYDAGGARLTGISDRHFSPATSGTYYLGVGAGSGGNYVVSIKQATDDYREDILTAGVFRETVNGTADADLFTGTGAYTAYQGGDGNDRYVAGGGFDLFDGGEGVDSVSFAGYASGVTVDLAALGLYEGDLRRITLTNVENVQGTRYDDRLTGNGAANLLTGGLGADNIVGGAGDDVIEGGYGSDILTGGPGIDTLSYENARTGVVVSLATTGPQSTRGAGIDTVSGFENLRGSNSADVLIGDNRGNVISGLDGADRMIGLGGDDHYYVDNVGDQVVERIGRGHDTVHSGVSYTLPDNVEALVLLGGRAIDAFGNGYDNVLVGNRGNNILRGDDGNDVLTGGAGIDYFVFDTAPGAGNIDQITDFSMADDTISLNPNIFFSIEPAGTLAAGAFQSGAVATEADDRILYDGASGNIYYDADGNGAGAAVLFAQVTARTALSNADFVVIG
ncbi:MULTISPECIES: calcium-binding protein [unclassified Sphingobium]|uniref:calcium-binding protein n=1 Tax=unclassified Sphingobium TaxID=2611147 RepID=UPI0035A6339E